MVRPLLPPLARADACWYALLPAGAHLLLGPAGVLNGIDTQEWNPEIDERIYAKYSAEDLAEGKAANKLALQKELGLAERADVSPPRT